MLISIPQKFVTYELWDIPLEIMQECGEPLLCDNCKNPLKKGDVAYGSKGASDLRVFCVKCVSKGTLVEKYHED